MSTHTKIDWRRHPSLPLVNHHPCSPFACMSSHDLHYANDDLLILGSNNVVASPSSPFIVTQWRCRSSRALVISSSLQQLCFVHIPTKSPGSHFIQSPVLPTSGRNSSNKSTVTIATTLTASNYSLARRNPCCCDGKHLLGSAKSERRLKFRSKQCPADFRGARGSVRR